MPTSFKLPLLTSASAALLTAGCVAGPAPANNLQAIYAPGQVALLGSKQPQGDWIEAAQSARSTPACMRTEPASIRNLNRVAPTSLLNRPAPLAAGDRLEITVLGDRDKLTGIYVVGSSGTIALDGIPPISVVGQSPQTLTSQLRQSLVAAGIVRPLRNAVRVALVEAAGASVAVTGAVFVPGAVRAGERSSKDRVGLKEGAVTGDNNVTRTMAGAIRATGGVRPDADVSRVYLIRGKNYAEIDLSGLVDGSSTQDVAIANGDQVIVPSRTCFDESLVRPTPLTQPGIRVYMSNLTRGANNNAGAAIGRQTTSFPYGTRLLQALVAANCVGGSYMQSDRRAVLISRNPINRRSIVIERDIEKMVRGADRDTLDPYLMPGDSIACYDSRWTNLREAVGLVVQVGSTATPAILLDNAL
ncbi:MAG: polysaccharide biosynthesis/export family protein [Marinomonas sp.]